MREVTGGNESNCLEALHVDTNQSMGIKTPWLWRRRVKSHTDGSCVSWGRRSELDLESMLSSWG